MPTYRNAQPEAIGAGQCPEMIRTERGYETCHLAEHAPEVRHHVRDRSWLTLEPATPHMRLGVPCGEACLWPDRVLPYLGAPPGAASLVRAPAHRGPIHRARAS